jgi:predicted acylesterase/phospholipase RssA
MSYFYNADTIVISGNSTNCIKLLGTLQLLYEKKVFNNITNWVGTSSGSILSLFCCLNIEPKQIIFHLCKYFIFKKVKFNYINMFKNESIINEDFIRNTIKNIILEKHDNVPTLNEIFEKYNKNLIFTTIQTDNVENTIKVDKDSFPNINVIDALFMSISFPVIFKPYMYEEKYYIDGGLNNNFPINIGEEISKTFCLGIYIKDISKTNTDIISNQTIKVIYNLMKNNFNIVEKLQIKYSTKTKFICISNKCTFFNFNKCNGELLKEFIDGYNQCKNILSSD